MSQETTTIHISKTVLYKYALPLFTSTIALIDEIKKSGDEDKYKALFEAEVAIHIILKESGVIK